MVGKAKGPPLKDADAEYPGFLWHVWAPNGRKRLHNLRVVDSVVMINGRIRAWIFYSQKEKRILSKKTQNITVQGIWNSFCRGRKSYDCVASFTSPYRPSHLPPCPNWIADGVATTPHTVDKHVQYFSPKGLNAFLRMAEKHSEVDKAWELQLSKKYNDLAGSGKRSNWIEGEASKPKSSAWEAAYPDQNIPHGFTGVLRRFDNPMGDTNHEIICTLTPKMFLCERRSCKHRIATPGMAMIHRLDIHSGGARMEDVSGTALATTLENAARSIVQHVSSVASLTRLDKCSLVFRLLPDNSHTLVACVFLRAYANKSFTINSVNSAVVNKARWSRAQLTHEVQSLARLVSIVSNGAKPVDQQQLEQPMNISEDGRMFTCAITGMELPIHQAHRVTIKQLLAYHDQNNQKSSKLSFGLNEIPAVIQRALPGLKEAEFLKLQTQTHFLLSWAFVRESEAVQLLHSSLQVLLLQPLLCTAVFMLELYIHTLRDVQGSSDSSVAALIQWSIKHVFLGFCDIQVFNGPAEMEKVKERFARKRELQDLAALGVPLDRAECRLLGLSSSCSHEARPQTSPKLSSFCLSSSQRVSGARMSAAEWLNRERPSTTSVMGITQDLNERHPLDSMQTSETLKFNKTARSRASEVRFNCDGRLLPTTMPARAWKSVDPGPINSVIRSDPLQHSLEHDGRGAGEQSGAAIASPPRSSSLPAHLQRRQSSLKAPSRQGTLDFKARPFPRIACPEPPELESQLTDVYYDSSNMHAIQAAAGGWKGNAPLSTTSEQGDRQQQIACTEEEASRRPNQDVGTSLSNLLTSHDELSAASQSLIRRASELLHQTGSAGMSAAGASGTQSCHNGHFMEPLPRQDQELLTSDEQHLLSDMISVL